MHGSLSVHTTRTHYDLTVFKAAANPLCSYAHTQAWNGQKGTGKPYPILPHRGCPLRSGEQGRWQGETVQRALKICLYCFDFFNVNVFLCF